MKTPGSAPPPGPESVWDYPRPPRLEPTARRLIVIVGGEMLAESVRGYRVLETSHPPTYYLPPEDVRTDRLRRSGRHGSLCEFKGAATYWDIETPDGLIAGAAWSYPDPWVGFEPIRDFLAFYPSRVDACLVDDMKVSAQDGDFYGGWITPDITGPFKGPAGTAGW